MTNPLRIPRWCCRGNRVSVCYCACTAHAFTLTPDCSAFRIRRRDAIHTADVRATLRRHSPCSSALNSPLSPGITLPSPSTLPPCPSLCSLCSLSSQPPARTLTPLTEPTPSRHVALRRPLQPFFLHHPQPLLTQQSAMWCGYLPSPFKPGVNWYPAVCVA